MAEITRKSVLLECLSIMREEQRICSKGYNCLEPAKGMEEAWEQGRRKITILQEIIQALDSEPVLRAMANWQKEIMEKGTPEKLEIEGGSRREEVGGLAAGKAIDELTKDDISPKQIIRKTTEDVTEKIRSYYLDNEDGTMELR